MTLFEDWDLEKAVLEEAFDKVAECEVGGY